MFKAKLHQYFLFLLFLSLILIFSAPQKIMAATCSNVPLAGSYTVSDNCRFDGTVNGVEQLTTIILNSATNKTCSTICNERLNMTCSSVGTNSAADNGKYWYSWTAEGEPYECTLLDATCESQMIDISAGGMFPPNTCDVGDAYWTYCKCSSAIDPAGDLTIAAGMTLTVNATQTIVFNPGSRVKFESGAGLAIASGGRLSVGYIWYPDANSDNFPDTLGATASRQSPGSSYHRRSSDRFIVSYTGCGATTTDKITCGPGRYLDGSNNCVATNIGSYSPVCNNDHIGCAAGTYTGSTGQSSCTDCQAGYKCEGSKDRIQCNTGYYQDALKQASCKECGSSAYYCPAGQPNTTRTSVSSGYYSTGGISTTRTGQSACGGNQYYCQSGVRYDVASGYYSTGNTSTTRTGQTCCQEGTCCSSGVKSSCPSCKTSGSCQACPCPTNVDDGTACVPCQECSNCQSGVCTYYCGGPCCPGTCSLVCDDGFGCPF